MTTTLTPGFTEAWFSEENQRALVACGRAVLGLHGLIIEVGAWEGRSTVALANAINPRQMVSVDTWQGSPSEISGELAQQRDVFAQWQCNVDAFTGGNVEPKRMGWREYVDVLTGKRGANRVALVFIDAEHTYREVFDCVSAFRPLMVPGGIMCGDDAHHGPVRRALADTLGAQNVEVRPTNFWFYEVPS